MLLDVINDVLYFTSFVGFNSVSLLMSNIGNAEPGIMVVGRVPCHFSAKVN